ncbi:hypothetical protein CQ046_17675 [Chryseobacterium sp. MYb7]|uniref:hypothetical protein n=1 Tax=Chryseobacterium sp. MYb7 TaxID=1827290 RepID=UPI000D00DD2A|nr:hypothetical protein [Chryseobacterium sp. MYb7]PRB00659.1 hypothetical protein CQ046_17675 [Chryseobacterium sp. MYb7]
MILRYPDSLSLETLNEQNSLPKDRPVFIEGYQFNDTATLVYNEMISNIEVIDTNGQKKHSYFNHKKLISCFDGN